MTSDPFHALLGRLVAAVEQDAELRASLAALARAAAGWLDRGSAPAPPVAEPPPALAEPPAPEPSAPPPEPPGLTINDLNIKFLPPPDLTPAAVGMQTELDSDRVPMPVLASRCRAKAAACRLLAGQPGDRTAVERKAAALPACRLWMFFDDPPVKAPAVWRDLAGAYETLAAACDLVHNWDSLPEAAATPLAADLLPLVAEAQSTVLTAVGDTRMLTGYDEEQLQVFFRLRDETERQRVFVRRFMRRTESADPANWPDVLRRINAFADRVRAASTVKQQQKQLKNVLRKLELVRADPTAHADEWPRIVELIGELVAGGLPPTNADLRDQLLAVWDHLPAGLAVSDPANRVLLAAERFQAERPAPATAADPEPPSAEVAAVAAAIGGRELVLIGGQARPNHIRALREAFGLADVRWLSFPDHTSYTVFEPDIARPEVAVVVLAIRWTNHDHERVADYCRRYDKPFVRLTAGYNPNMLAHQIVSQAGRKLGLAGD